MIIASFAIATVVVMFVPSHPAYFTSLLATLSGLYATALMTVLNVRITTSVDSYSNGTSKTGHSELEFNHNRPQYMSTGGTSSNRVIVSAPRGERIYGEPVSIELLCLLLSQTSYLCVLGRTDTSAIMTPSGPLYLIIKQMYNATFNLEYHVCESDG